MKPKTFRHCLSLLLACVLLVQAAFVVADWQVEIPQHAVHSVAMAHCDHHTTQSATTTISDSTSPYHHACCHAGNGSLLSMPSYHFLVPFGTLSSLLPAFALEPYRDPLADQLIRPPIA